MPDSANEGMDSREQEVTEATVRILEALYPDGDQRLSSFLYGIPGTPLPLRRLGAEVFVREHLYIEALLFVRQHGAPFLKDISMDDLWSMTTSFVTEHYAYIAEGRLRLAPGLSLAQQVSPAGVAALARSLAHSVLFSPKNDVTLYPLSVVKVRVPFQSRHFALVVPDGLADTLDSFGRQVAGLLPAQFPPFGGLLGTPEPTANWLCVSTPAPLVAHKHARAILGALALTTIRRERYLQTGRSVQGGHCTISAKGYSCSPGADPMTPRMPSDIHVSQLDHSWLGTLSALFDSTERAQRSKVRALEYFYRAWFDDPRERFPTMCMALDSLVAAKSRHTGAAVEFIRATVDEPIDEDRLRLLLKLRGAVMHGAAPDVYESEHYEAYYSKYSESPICDLDLLVARCLRQSVFGGQLIAHPDPHAALVKQQQALGRLPRNLRGRSIIADD